MYKTAVKYKDMWLAPGCDALGMLLASKTDPSKLKQLESHIKILAAREDALIRFAPKVDQTKG